MTNLSNEYWFIYKNNTLVGITDQKLYLNLYCLCRKKYLDPEQFNLYYIDYRCVDDMSYEEIEYLTEKDKMGNTVLGKLSIVELDEYEEFSLDKIVLSSNDLWIYVDYLDEFISCFDKYVEIIKNSKKYLNKYNNHKELFDKFEKSMEVYAEYCLYPGEDTCFMKKDEVFKWLLKSLLIY